jgi:hypothetical protein
VKVPEAVRVLPDWLMVTVGVGVAVTAKFWDALAPQPLLAMTVIFPPEVPAVAVMLFVVLVPIHPVGKAHV